MKLDYTLAGRVSKTRQDDNSTSALLETEKLFLFAEKELLNFTLLSDEDHEVAQAFGVWGEKQFMGKTYDGIHRISFLIGTDGKIEHVFDKFKTSDHEQVVPDHLKSHS
ncbi:hypothetical protein GCM10009131_06240 [Morganella psychrotolerans]